MIATVFCLARDEVRAMRVLDELRAAGFSEDRISVLLPEKAVAGGFGPAFSPAGPPGTGPDPRDESGCSVVLQGLPHRTSLSRPELGRFIGAGPLMLRLYAPTARHGANGLLAELTDAGLPRGRGEYFQQQLAEGKILLSVFAFCLDETSRVQAVLGRAGAEDVLVRGEASSEDPACGLVQLSDAA